MKNKNKTEDLKFLTKGQKVAKGVTSGIYKITNPEGHVYVGGSQDIHVRWINHTRFTSTTALKNSIDKYGKNSHTLEIILPLPLWTSNSILKQFESKYIQSYKEQGIKLLNRNGGGNGRISRPVEQYKDGVLIKSWNSMYEAAATLGLNVGGIFMVANNKGKSYKGFVWKYVEK